MAEWPAMGAEPTWVAKQKFMEKALQESLDSLKSLDQAAPKCSDNYVKSICPNTLRDPPKISFYQTLHEEIAGQLKAVKGVAKDAEAADRAVADQSLAKVDACAGAADTALADTKARKAAVDNLLKVFSKAEKSLRARHQLLHTGGSEYQAKAKACGSEVSSFSFLVTLPKNPYEALEKMFTRDSSHPNCLVPYVQEFQKLVGKTQTDSSLVGDAVNNFSSYAKNLEKKTEDLGSYLAKLEKTPSCETAAGPKETEQKPVVKPEKVVPKAEEVAATPKAAKDKKETPVETPPVLQTDLKPEKKTPPLVEQASAGAGALDAVLAEEKPKVDIATGTDVRTLPVVAEPAPDPNWGAAQPVVENGSNGSASWSTGKAVAAVAVVGAVGAGVGYLIYKDKKGKSRNVSQIADPPLTTSSSTATSTSTTSSTNTGTATSSATASGTTTATSTATSTSTATPRE